MLDHLIRNGTILDGTGSPAYIGDIAVSGANIAAVGRGAPIQADVNVIDASGLCVAPGFIDMHSHSDYSLLHDKDAGSALAQGVTMEVMGNCGYSCYPVVRNREVQLQSYLAGLGCNDHRELEWQDFDGYAGCLEDGGLGINVVSLVGHGSIRIAVMGFDNRRTTDREQEEMRRLVRLSLEQGAFGLFSGLVYPPGIISPPEELEDLCRIVAEKKGLYSTHLRGDTLRAGPTLLESLEEAVRIAETTGIILQVSHVAPKIPNNGTAEAIIERMQRARDQGYLVSCDVHPYMATLTFLASFLPPWVFEGGTNETVRRLNDRGERTRILEALRSQFRHLGWESFWYMNEPIITDTDSPYRGKRFSEIGKTAGREPEEIFLDMLQEAGDKLFKPMVLSWIYSEEDTLQTFLWPSTMVGADGTSSSIGGPVESLLTAHPRSWGTFPRVIAKYHKKAKKIGLENVIYKMTGLPASVLGLRDRGRIQQGCKADLVVFDPENLRDRADYHDPHAYAEGIRYLFVNGRLAMENGRFTGERAGIVLKRI
jgi:N-acyl-D-amino-acid deacylase